MSGFVSTAVFTVAVAIGACTPSPAPSAEGSDVPAEAADTTTDNAGAAGEPASRSGAESRPSDPSHLTPEGWGPLRIGMTRAEVVAAAGEDANPEAVGGPEPDVCDQLRPTEAPDGLLVMIERDRLTRISVADPADITTDRGFGVGSDGDEIAEAYGDAATRSPHKYLDAPAEYITVWSTDPAADDPRGLVYETGMDGRVTHVHAGGASIRYVEGCL